ncbi:hypothetical protein [Afipia felis]|uniref:Uncharacterized protein n=2 Tax=Afipia felis TaxID=1035 RepID=A0A380WBB3_AFIFE|nr:hypothetical protein [Afipia felis]EKS29430.1 hypothetical protein HMPREF9697_01958 [Afipia felis ATCC 53690]SUU78137.1 Uncharacterised protein [Afipia felis]SUU86202.1 Uncharacterised protein [Afipia felis]
MTKEETKSPPSASAHITSAFFNARAKYRNLHTAWTNLSGLLSGRFSLPVAMIHLQRQGDADLLIRCMEDEFDPERARAPSNIMEFSPHYQIILSEAWIIGCYEVLRALKQRDDDTLKQRMEPSGVSSTAAFRSIFSDFELLRMPIAKYEIAKDKALKQPLIMKAIPPNDDTTDKKVYDKDDPKRTHIMPTGLSERGSTMWMTFDHKNSKTFWIERRDLSDRLLALQGGIEPAGLREARLKAEGGE